MKNTHILPTDKPSRLLYNFTLESFCIQKEKDEMYINDGKVSGADFWSIEKANNNGFRYVNIYITSDKEIKEEDWFYLDDAEIIAKYIDVKPVKESKKIILSTDQDLIKDGIQPIDDEFLEWFVKNPSCEEIEIFHQDVYSMGKWDRRYKIIIPQQEPKQFKRGYDLAEKAIQKGECPKELLNQSRGSLTFDDFDKGWKAACNKAIIPQKESTLEEAAENYGNNIGNKNGTAQFDFIRGAKWQAERMYNEEDMNLAFETGRNFQLTGENNLKRNRK